MIELLAQGGPALEVVQKHLRQNLEHERLTNQAKATEVEPQRERSQGRDR
jgi:hypothetical protein